MTIKSISKIKYIFFLFCVFVLTFSSCKNSNEDKPVKIDFSQRTEIHHSYGELGPPLRAAVSAMISPEENFFHYNDVLEYVSHKIGKKIIFKQRKSYQEINELLRMKELDFALICSGAYVEAKKDFSAEIIAVPQIKGETSYFAYIIVHNDSNITNFEDLKGRSFAFTDPLSNTGCLYPKYIAKKMYLSDDKFFSHVIYTFAHDYSIQAVANKIVDAASVDSLIFDFMQSRDPQKTSAVKIIKRSIPFGTPPIVVHPEMDPKLKRKLQSVFLNMSTDPEGREVLSHLNIDTFVPGNDKNYGIIRRMKTFLQE